MCQQRHPNGLLKKMLDIERRAMTIVIIHIVKETSNQG